MTLALLAIIIGVVSIFATSQRSCLAGQENACSSAFLFLVIIACSDVGFACDHHGGRMDWCDIRTFSTKSKEIGS